MPAAIVLSDVTLSTPDGRLLLSNVDLSFGPGRTGLVGRNGVGKTTLLRAISRDVSPQSGSVSVSGVLGTLRQTVHVQPDETIADLFGAADALSLLRRAEAGNATADELAEIDWTIGSRIETALRRVDLDIAPETARAALSGGEHTRVALAALIFAEPDFLLLDEPTNNLDRDGRATSRQTIWISRPSKLSRPGCAPTTAPCSWSATTKRF